MRVSTTPRKYTVEFREEAIALFERGDRTGQQLAEDLGVPYCTLRNWWQAARMAKKRKQLGGATTPPDQETVEQRLARLEREIAALRRENASLKMDREILKKAAAFFAKENE